MIKVLNFRSLGLVSFSFKALLFLLCTNYFQAIFADEFGIMRHKLFFESSTGFLISKVVFVIHTWKNDGPEEEHSFIIQFDNQQGIILHQLMGYFSSFLCQHEVYG